MQRQAVASLG
jgi:hypothetical protein